MLLWCCSPAGAGTCSTERRMQEPIAVPLYIQLMHSKVIAMLCRCRTECAAVWIERNGSSMQYCIEVGVQY